MEKAIVDFQKTRITEKRRELWWGLQIFLKTVDETVTFIVSITIIDFWILLSSNVHLFTMTGHLPIEFNVDLMTSHASENLLFKILTEKC